MSDPAGVELVVLLDEGGHAIGTADKATVHHARTPLHLAFSCYLADDQGRLLMTRRALTKPTWPGVWTNSVCGHPGPGESLPDAVRRRVRAEVGLDVTDVRLLLPEFGYRAVMGNGVVEHELCPVYVATAVGAPAPDPTEVEDLAWVDWSSFRTGVLDGTREISPWCLEQVQQLPPDPWAAEARPDSLLPPAARLPAADATA